MLEITIILLQGGKVMFSGYLLNRDRMSMKKKRLFLSGLAAFLILFAPIASSTYAAESEPVEVGYL